MSTFKSESSVGMISGVLRQTSLSDLGAMRLGQRMRKGDASGFFIVDVFLNATVCAKHSPWSDVKTTRVSSARLNLSIASKIRPTFQSRLAVIAA